MSCFDFKIKRVPAPFFAPWAVMNKPFTEDKHYLKDYSVCYDIKSGEKYSNHIEMSGFYTASIISYGADKAGRLRIMRHTVFPSLRLYPNETRSSLDYNFAGISLKANGSKCEKAKRFEFDGMLHIYSRLSSLEIKRTLFSAQGSKACIECIGITNNSNSTAEVEIINNDSQKHISKRYSANGEGFKIFTQTDTNERRFLLNSGESKTIWVAYCASKENERFEVDFKSEYDKRRSFLAQMKELLVIDTPDNVLNTMAYFAKIRAAESIFKTKAGLMHCPGGGGYYAALWTNDQCEYVNPMFAYLGYQPGIEESLNCYSLYKKYLSPDKALITSIIAEGDGIWHGAKDRGDSAMYAYGCTRFLLANGNAKTAQEYIGAIRDCLSYTISQINSDGVVKSDSDELENRFESGNANLSTSCLAYDALISASMMERDLDNPDKACFYEQKADELKKAIEQYFGKNVEGYETYMYCKEEKRLRSWIALPLVMGINERSSDTAKALMSPLLRKSEGLVTRAGGKTFWDRSTLYALRGLFYSGFTEEAYELLEVYSHARLLGEHIPYAVEAFPEGNQAQLSAESGLYIRVYIEGILGYRPTGFSKFEITPHLPEKWQYFNVKSITLCGKKANVYVERENDKYRITVQCEDKEYSALAEKAEFDLKNN
ncbi:MAG: hypothetical protein ACI4IQ_03680 [Eubacterium sp.]